MDHVNQDGKNLDGEKVEDMRLLHVYGQYNWHDDVRIVGNRVALEGLRDAIDAALKAGDGGQSQADVFVTDGEGYGVIVRVEDGPWDGEWWRDAAMPYSDEIAAAGNEREGVIWPFQRDPRYHENVRAGLIKPVVGRLPR